MPTFYITFGPGRFCSVRRPWRHAFLRLVHMDEQFIYNEVIPENTDQGYTSMFI